jgi:hypothetical protein
MFAAESTYNTTRSVWNEMQEYSISDVKLAIGRVLLWHLGESC